MNKQVFTVEIELVGERKPLGDFQLFAAIKTGLDELFDGDFRAESVKETTVEQTVEHPRNQDKTLDLLRRASERLHDYAIDFTSGNSDSLAAQIDDFLDGKQ